jgi:hypothetical protein
MFDSDVCSHKLTFLTSLDLAPSMDDIASKEPILPAIDSEEQQIWSSE